MSAIAVDESLFDGAGAMPTKASGVYIRFHKEPVRSKAKSEAAGRPIFDEVEYIEIRTPGDKTNIVDRPVTEADRRQYAAQYRAWKAGDDEQLSGTPLAQWPSVTRAQVEELRYFGVRTVEQLAAMSDGNLQNVGPIRALRQQAIDFLEAARGNAPLTTLRAELAKRDNELDALRKQVEALTSAASEVKRGPGRPPKQHD